MAKITPNQKETLLKFMEENYNRLYGKFSVNIHSKKKKWNDISEELNKLGPPKKDVDKWEKVNAKLIDLFHFAQVFQVNLFVFLFLM